ncbi:MAG: hypothetical protein IJH63_10310 [Methanobrevibacter sp.]|nr:hypothetical protein [Methanosphaera sp.]MBR0371092.1 hypothetical protein [Methanobrevibacter sp.]
MIGVKGTEYIHLIKSTGNYQVSKKLDGRQVSFGNYNTLNEAKRARDYFQKHGWKTSERLCYSKSRYIQKLPSGRYQVNRQWNNTKVSYGTFDTLEEAEYQVLLCKRFNWDIRLKLFDCMKHIIKRNDGRKAIYRIGREEDGKTVYYGSFENLIDAQFERDLLILCDWDYEAISSIDETSNGLLFLNGKTASTLYRQNPKGVNDYFFYKYIKEWKQ